MAEYRITRWEEIPSMVTARDGAGGIAKVQLPDRFQEAIDEAAMERGLAGTDAYLERWTHGDWVAEDGAPDAVAARVAERLEQEFPA
jgi:Virulence factor